MEDEQLVHEFEDWELRCQDEDDKGKRPVYDSSDDEEEHQGGMEGGDAAVSGAAECEGSAAPASPRGSDDAGELTCAICLCGIPLENMALVKGCDHMYCATCILHWALHKEEPWCPQCKQPFNFLLTYRSIDGELHDFPSEEPVCLLKRAPWFEEHLRFVDRSSARLVEESRMADQMAWQEYAGDYDLAEDEEIEQYYFSSAAGRARVVLGNRRYGEGGFISGGRRQARPAPERRRSSKAGKVGEHAVVGAPPLPPSTSIRTPNAGGGRKARPSSGSGAGGGAGMPVASGSVGADFYGSSPGSANGSALFGTSPCGSGRRARRNARRTAIDAGLSAAAGGSGGRC